MATAYALIPHLVNASIDKVMEKENPSYYMDEIKLNMLLYLGQCHFIKKCGKCLFEDKICYYVYQTDCPHFDGPYIYGTYIGPYIGTISISGKYILPFERIEEKFPKNSLIPVTDNRMEELKWVLAKYGTESHYALQETIRKTYPYNEFVSRLSSPLPPYSSKRSEFITPEFIQECYSKMNGPEL